MRLYYGTTSALASRIRRQGLRLVGPFPQIWLSRSLAVAQSRARELCRTRRGRPAVLVCEVDLARWRQQWGNESVRCRGPMVELVGRIEPAQVAAILPVTTADETAAREPVLTEMEVFGLLDSPSPRVRQMGVMMLMCQRCPQAFDWLCTMLTDADPRVRLAVVMALRQRGQESGDLLRGMAHDKHPAVRRAVRAALEAQPLTTA